MSISIGMVGLGMFGPSFIQSYKAHPDVHRLASLNVDLTFSLDKYVTIYNLTDCQNGQNSLK